MAKTIIHQGTDTYHGHCPECGTDFTYERVDVRHNYAHGGEEVGCPHCGHACRHLGASGTRWPSGRPGWTKARLCAPLVKP
jgi:DNA-directed RNA polymerase subunit RPC12/RpoP